MRRHIVSNIDLISLSCCGALPLAAAAVRARRDQPVRQRWLGARTPYGGTGYPSENVPNAVVVDDAVGCVAHDIEIELAS